MLKNLLLLVLLLAAVLGKHLHHFESSEFSHEGMAAFNECIKNKCKGMMLPSCSCFS